MGDFSSGYRDSSTSKSSLNSHSPGGIVGSVRMGEWLKNVLIFVHVTISYFSNYMQKSKPDGSPAFSKFFPLTLHCLGCLLMLLLGFLLPVQATTLAQLSTLQWSEAHNGTPFAPNNWTLTFSDNFNYDPTLADITADTSTTGPWYAPGHASYGVGTFQHLTDPEYPNTFISLTEGGLEMRAQRNTTTSSAWYTAGMATVNTSGLGFVQSYGYYEASVQLPVSTGAVGKYGAWPSFWLLSQNGFDTSRTDNRVEIDAMEWYSTDPDAHHGTVHLIDPSNNRQTMANYHGFGYNLSSAPHTFGVKITPSWVITYMDRLEIARFPTVEEFGYPLYMLVDNAISASTGTHADLGETEWDYIIDNVSAYAMPTTVTVDNTDSNATVTGTWTASTNSTGYYGSNYLDDGAAGKGTKSVTFTPQLPCDGAYQVYTRWISGSNRSTSVPYTITSSTGTQTVTKSQTENGSQWVLLGTYYFNEGSGGSVTISNTGTANGTYVIADAVQFVLLDPFNRVIDNTDPADVALTGTWTASTSPTGFYGANCITDGATGKGTKSIRYAADVPKAGSYEVFTCWTSSPNRATNVPIAVTDDSGTTNLTVNQQTNGGAWYSLGVYDFTPGSSDNVTISNTGTASGSYVIADAVQFVKQFENADVYGDNADTTGVTITGAWSVSTNSSGYYGTNYLTDNATGKGTKSVQFNPTLPYAGTYEVFARWTSGASRANNVPITITSASGATTVPVSEQLNNNEWVSLGLYNFNAGSSGSVLISNTGTANGYYVIVDAVKFERR
jgi:hypothetical protein